MNAKVRRIFVEKKKGFDIEAQGLYRDLKINLGISGLKTVRIINRYDVAGVSDKEYEASRNVIFSEPPADVLYDEVMDFDCVERVFAIEYLPGQYDQRADSASQCIQMITLGERPQCRVARLIALKGDISDGEFTKIKEYCINPVESHEASLEKPWTLDVEVSYPGDVQVLEGFTHMCTDELASMMKEMGLAMSLEDLAFCREYFRTDEKRDPTVTELRLIDTYWSDHCRHTTFLTKIENVEFEEGYYKDIIKSAYDSCIKSREFVYEGRDKDFCLMDLATIAMKELKKKGILDDLDISDEINACSITVNAHINGKDEEWLVMFKNETHNHPTEIEPFGGAATCLGGAIRDPLSGRAYVYQAMRVTGSGDPRTGIKDTIPGKLPQRKITTGAAAGYSSYGNQIGLATGQVAEIYDEGYVAKRMEIGAVIGAAPRRNIVREKPQPGDVIILLGGRTGRDGCGGATGSSKEHNEESLLTCGAEVQKGNPPTERKIQRLFRNAEVSRMIKRCNDFGAGGVSVAIGELAEGLEINLDAVPRKYEGLDGTELAISESQERMAVVVTVENEQLFIAKAGEENLEATTVAKVTGEGRLRMVWRGKTIVDVSREFLDTNGVKQTTSINVAAPQKDGGYFDTLPEELYKDGEDITAMWINNLQRLNVCSQKGLVERFDSTIGAGSVLMPFGGRYQLSPAEGMAAKLPVLEGDTSTGTLMTFGYNPSIARWSPFHGALYAVVEAVARITAMGGNYRRVRLTLQEYFEKLGKDAAKWGKPFSALLGAYFAQMKLGIPAIGGKDSMSGTFKEMTVPPTLVAFAVDTVNVGKVISTEFKKTGSQVVVIMLDRDTNDLPDFMQLDRNYTRIHALAGEGRILAAYSIRQGGIAEAVSKMCFGNRAGFTFTAKMEAAELFAPLYGSIVLEIDAQSDAEELFEGLKYKVIGCTTVEEVIMINNVEISLETAIEKWMEPIERIFPTKVGNATENRPLSQTPTNATENRPLSHPLSQTGDGSSFATGDGSLLSHSGDNLFDATGDGSPLSHSGDNLFLGHSPMKQGRQAVSCNRSLSRIAKPRIFIPVFPGTNCEYDTARAFEKAGGQADVMVLRNLTSADLENTIQIMKQKIDKSQIVMIPGGFSAGDEPDGSGKFIAAAFRNPYIREAVMELLKKRDGLVLGICNGFQALIKLGLVPFGEIRDMNETSPTLTFNSIGRHVSCMVRTRVASNLSPWFNNVKAGDIHTIAISHGEGRFVANTVDFSNMAANGQIATQYVDMDGNATYDIRFNPNGSMYAVEGITSPDGRVLGKMGHSERIGTNVARNVPGEKDQKLFEAGVMYFE